MYKSVIEYLLNSVKKYPDKVAFEDVNAKLTFTQVLERAKKIGKAISFETKGELKQPIVVYMEKSVDMLCVFLGIAYSGNFYTPIDIKMPKTRAKMILKTLEPKIIISDRKVSELFIGIKAINYSDAIEMELCDEVETGYKKILDIDPLYVLFTSGSTGKPKGVTISNRGVIDYTEWVVEKFSFDENTVFGNQAPFYFDNSILDIYSTLKNGSRLVIIPEKLFTFPQKLCDFINEYCINTIFWVPSALISVANSGVLDKNNMDKLDKVLFCGEVMPNKQLNIWRKHYPNVLYANLYGPTEITDVCSYYIVNREFLDDEPLPIGYACENTDIIVLNDRDELVDGDEAGELCVRGCSVSMGYYKNDEQSSLVFIQNPLNKAYRDIIYRTGDIVKYNHNGELIYLSRKDYQIKHQGHRIELGEIEVVATAQEGVDSSCVLYDSKNKQIVLFYSSGSGINEKELYKGLKAHIPNYMMPGKIVFLEQFPINLNGKIDRVILSKRYID